MTDASEAARQLAAQRKTVSKTCAECGQPFTGLKKRRFCTDLCGDRFRKRAWWRRSRSRQAQDAAAPATEPTRASA